MNLREEYRAALRQLLDDPALIELPPALPGIRAERLSNYQIELHLSHPPEESLAELLDWLPPERTLQFSDNFHPGGPDPGAGVTVQRDHHRYVYQTHNHANSSLWCVQSKELIVAWIKLNIRAAPPYKRLREISLRRAPSYSLDPRYGAIE